MEVQKLHESVRVYVDFQANQIKPVAFLWNGRKYVIAHVNLVYRRRLGARFVWCFAVSDQGNTFVLVYDPETLGWVLEEVSAI